MCWKQSLKCRIFSSIVCTQKAPKLFHPESLNILTAILFLTTIEESLYKHNSRDRKDGVAPFKSIDCNWSSTPRCAYKNIHWIIQNIFQQDSCLEVRLDTPKIFIGSDTIINYYWLSQYVGNFSTMNQIYRLLKCGCYISNLPICKQLHGNGLSLTTTSANIDWEFMDLLRKEVWNGEFAQNQRIRSHALSMFFLALDLCRQHAVRRNSTRHK